jgi:molybdopterin-binding protein
MRAHGGISDDAVCRPFAADPNGAVRNGSPLNLVILVRVGSDGLNEETRARAEDQANDPTSAPPQPGDRLIFLTGPKKGQPARSDDLELDGPQMQAYPEGACAAMKIQRALGAAAVLAALAAPAALGHGVLVTASITNDAVDELKLKKGDKAYAVIKATDVMVGLD